MEGHLMKTFPVTEKVEGVAVTHDKCRTMIVVEKATEVDKHYKFGGCWVAFMRCPTCKEEFALSPDAIRLLFGV